MNVDPIHSEFGARVTGVDLSRPLDDATFAQIDEAINRYSILLFEDQRMNDAAHLEFTRRFGQLEEEHVSYYSRGEVTYIGRVGNIDDDGNRVSARHIKASTGNEMWHSDSSFREIPAMYSLLCAYEVPDEAGETEFASARAAYARLDRATRQQIEDRVGIHDYIFSRTKVGEDAVTQNQRTFMHPVRQRLVRQNPVTGEKNIYVGSHVKAVEGMPDAEARPLIDRLIDEVTRPESVYRHRWRVGDFMIWDNRCILHRGCGYDAEKYRRRMHQTRVRGLSPSLAEQLDDAS
ncbi:MAG: TauD/TfdA family dioxygenase [Gammaproteobacteria bacterium]|nr:TauD/TfdA family dioxygenase [Gammaproteobacteria bacterium]